MIPEVTAQEVGHQFVAGTTTDGGHTKGSDGRDRADTDRCLMRYDGSRNDGIVELCACPEQQKAPVGPGNTTPCHHLMRVRDAYDPL